MTVVDFFFSPGSRYSYLASTRVPAIASASGARFAWRPVRGTDIRALRGRDPFDGQMVSGQYDWAYRRRDAEAWADYYGVAYREPPSHEFDFELLARAAAAGALLDAAAPVGGALCALVYASRTWPIDAAACADAAAAAGVDRTAFERLLGAGEVRDLLTANAREAHARGAFGVPTCFVGERMFWGNDRLVLLEHALRGS